MPFTPITSNQAIVTVRYNTNYRNAARENLYGTNNPGAPVFYAPCYADASYSNGYGGPRYKYGYTYHSCPSPERNYNGNCTWWCWCRLYDTLGVALDGYGSGANWYHNHQLHGGQTSLNAADINPGDIICLTDGGDGHVMFVEDVQNDVITISQSAYSTRSIWSGKACLVTTYTKSQIYAGASVDIYKGLDSPAYETVVGILKTGEVPPPRASLLSAVFNRLRRKKKKGAARLYVR